MSWSFFKFRVRPLFWTPLVLALFLLQEAGEILDWFGKAIGLRESVACYIPEDRHNHPNHTFAKP